MGGSRASRVFQYDTAAGKGKAKATKVIKEGDEDEEENRFN